MYMCIGYYKNAFTDELLHSCTVHVFLSLKVVTASLKFFLNQSTPNEDSSDDDDDEVVLK